MRARSETLRLATLALLLGAACDELSLEVPAPRGAIETHAPHPRRAPGLVQALVGRGDVVAAALDGGVVLWDLSSGATRSVTRVDGLPSSYVAALALDGREDMLLAATREGLARGWWEGAWTSALTTSSGCGEGFLACTSRPGGGWVAGGEHGLLAAWTATRLDTLRLPQRARIVALAHAPQILVPPRGAIREAAGPAITPGFLPGLAVATDSSGLWIVRESGVHPLWLRLDARDGIPGREVRAAAADSRSRLWLATDAGIACVEPGFVVRSWPADPRLVRPARALHLGMDGWMYVGFDDGALRIDARAGLLDRSLVAEPVTGITGRVRALASAGGTLWWTDGVRVRSLSGRGLEPPGPIPPVVDPIWIGLVGVAPHGRPGTASAAVAPSAPARCVRGPRPSGHTPGRSRISDRWYDFD